MRPFWLILGALCLATITAAGCSAPGVPASSVLPVAPAPAAPIPVPSQSPPTWLHIPAIGAESSLIPVVLNADDQIDVSELETLQAAWYGGRDPDIVADDPLPGEIGVPAAIVGHVDGPIDGVKGQPGVFHRLSELKPGDEALIEREDGSRARFLVYQVDQYAKAAFPTDDVYAPTETPELRLITCGGAFGTARAGHYDDNTVVRARQD
jgi:hypothetical protein